MGRGSGDKRRRASCARSGKSELSGQWQKRGEKWLLWYLFEPVRNIPLPRAALLFPCVSLLFPLLSQPGSMLWVTSSPAYMLQSVSQHFLRVPKNTRSTDSTWGEMNYIYYFIKRKLRQRNFQRGWFGGGKKPGLWNPALTPIPQPGTT